MCPNVCSTDAPKACAESPLAFVDRVVGEIGQGPEAAVPILQAVHQQFRYLPQEALRRISETTAITPAQIMGVATFYPQFRLKPAGRHMISVCHGTACHVKGSALIDEALRRTLKITGDRDTDDDGVFTVRKVACLGCCTLAPVMQIDDVTYGHLTADTMHRPLRDFLELRRRTGASKPDEIGHTPSARLAQIRIGIGSCCVAGGSLEVADALARAVREGGALAAVKPVGCVGMCHQAPLVEIVDPDGARVALYAKVTPADAPGIVLTHFRPRGLLRRLRSTCTTALDRLLTDEAWEPVARHAIDARDAPVCAFLGPQHRIATEYCGDMDPLDLEEYETNEGLAALRMVVGEGLAPDRVIETMTRSGLRGRGGAGFPTGRKWAAVRAAPGTAKYVVANGDEGDPGAFMDRMLLESYPYRVLEGLTIAAYAVGAAEGILYVRAEYPLAVKRMREAIRRCESRRLLGDNILGTEFSLRLRVVEGAGAFVCGEETALIASIEGRRGMPALRPPYPAEKGLWGKPTNINNVETYALIPWIMRRGAEAFAALGTASSKGTKVFALAGKVVRGGLIEVPMGVSIGRIVEEIGGGVAEGHRLKAVQIGGPSGGCMPADLADTPVDYEALAGVGAMMGSGGLVVLDEQTCMVDMARYFLDFTQRESCGKCTFCRVGTRRLLDILERLCAGEGKRGDLEKLESLATQVKRCSLCGLGQTAPNPVLSTLRFFRDEYVAHMDGRCPAGVCKALIQFRIGENCIGCTRCGQACPVGAIRMHPYERQSIDDALCTRCGVCGQVCLQKAIVAA